MVLAFGAFAAAIAVGVYKRLQQSSGTNRPQSQEIVKPFGSPAISNKIMIRRSEPNSLTDQTL
jgi:hypothetical protein